MSRVDDAVAQFTRFKKAEKQCQLEGMKVQSLLVQLSQREMSEYLERIQEAAKP